MLSFDENAAAKPSNSRFPAGQLHSLPHSHRPFRKSEKSHHYNLSNTHRNQYLNTNLRVLKRRLNTSLDAKEFKAVDRQRSFSPEHVQSSGKPIKPQHTTSRYGSDSPCFPERVKSGKESGLDSQNLLLTFTASPLLGKIECPLNSPDFPPVGELDHLMGRCYCHICKCGSHPCPKEMRIPRSPQKRPMTTGCAAEGGKGVKQLRYTVEGEFVPNTQAIDFLTTGRRGYQSHRTKPTTAVSIRYQSDFPDYSPSLQGEAKRRMSPYCAPEVEIAVRRSYRDVYTTRSSITQRETASEKMNKTVSSFSPTVFTDRSLINDETAVRRQYKPFVKRVWKRKGDLLSAGNAHFKGGFQKQVKGLQKPGRFPAKGVYPQQCQY